MQGDHTHLLILESVQDPGNLGTMVRTGEGAGITGIIMNKTTVDLFNPKTIRSTMGSIYRIPYLITEHLPDLLDELHKENIRLYAAHLKGDTYYDAFDFTGACGFLIGNEGNGLSLTFIHQKCCGNGCIQRLHLSLHGNLQIAIRTLCNFIRQTVPLISNQEATWMKLQSVRIAI